MKKLFPILSLLLLLFAPSISQAQTINFISADSGPLDQIQINAWDTNSSPPEPHNIATVKNQNSSGDYIGLYLHSGYFYIDDMIATAWMDLYISNAIGSVSFSSLSNVPSEFNPAPHTHVVADISDATMIGQTLMLSSSQGDARDAIGAGTSSFSGVYNDLAGKPALFDGAYSSLSGIPSTFTPSSHSHSISDVTGLTAALAGKQSTITTGSSSQYLKGDLSLGTFPTTLDSFSSGTNSVVFSSANLAKLNGIAAGATANSSDATLLARANHTGTQAISTVSGLQTALDGKEPTITGGTTAQYLRGDKSLATFPTNLSQFTNNLSFISAGGAPVQSVNGQTGAVTIPTLTVYSGTTQRSNPVLITKSATTSSGVATFYLTADNTSTGTALCPNGVETTATNMAVNDSTGMFTYSWAFSNGNKTLTATVKALNLLALGLGNPANGTTVNLSVVCY